MKPLLLSLLMSLPSLTQAQMTCVLPTGPGPEDLTLIQWGGKPALITATARRLPWQKRHPQGALEVHEIGGAPRFTAIAHDYPGDWCPVGLCAVPTSTALGLRGKQLLYVINTTVLQGSPGGQVELFEIQGESKTLKHLRSLGPTPLMPGPNSIIATQDGTVYVSNFRLFSKRGLTLSVTPHADTAQLNSIVRYRPIGEGRGAWSVVATGINGANGLALSPDEKHLLCNAYHDKKVLSFTRAPADGRLTAWAVALNDLPFYPDNLKPLSEGRYCTAGQRSFLASGLHLLTVGLVPARGSAITFDYTPGQSGSVLTSWKEAMRRDRLCPSTALPHSGHLYLSHILRRGVTRVVER